MSRLAQWVFMMFLAELHGFMGGSRKGRGGGGFGERRERAWSDARRALGGHGGGVAAGGWHPVHPAGPATAHMPHTKFSGAEAFADDMHQPSKGTER